LKVPSRSLELSPRFSRQDFHDKVFTIRLS
jgi:hypothetical protein